MYFPFFYGRQGELLALRAMLTDHRSIDALVPIIEPVNNNVSELARCVEEYGKAGKALVVVFNPNKYRLESASDVDMWRKDILPVFEKHYTVLPALRCFPSTTLADINAFLRRFENREVVIIYSSSELNNEDIQALAKSKNVRFHVVLNGRMSAEQQDLLPPDKRVDVRDYFNKLARNADYEGHELFTDRHHTYKSSWAGFGDYTCVGSGFSRPGGPAAAVAIHAIYKHQSGSIWVEHFVSDDKTRDVGNIATKFLQAAGKLVAAAAARTHEFGSNIALDTYARHVEAMHFPNLRSNKTLQIQHHVCLMLDVLDERL